MKQTSIILIILILNSLIENAEMLIKKNKSFKAYTFETKVDDPNILLPKYGGQKFFKPIRINYILVTHQIVPNYKRGISNESFLLFKRLIIDPVDLFIKKTIKVFPLSNFPQNLNFAKPSLNTFLNFNVGKYVQGYVIIIIKFFSKFTINRD